MSDYVRNYEQGGTYFFTVNLFDRDKTTLIDHIASLRLAVAKVKKMRPFHIDAWVVLPDHLHCIWTLPENDHDYSGRWREIKKAFVKYIPKEEYRSANHLKHGERGIWQRRFWEHTIRDDNDYYHHMNYVHFNPVKHGYAETAEDWPYSSIHRKPR
jgi:putative transposase